MKAETTAYDPRYERAQTVGGAHARYIERGNGYGEGDLERDLERVLTEGENLDKTSVDELYDVALLGSNRVKPCR